MFELFLEIVVSLRPSSANHSRSVSSGANALDRALWEVLPLPTLRNEKTERTLRMIDSVPLWSKRRAPSIGSDAAMIETHTSIMPQITTSLARAKNIYRWLAIWYIGNSSRLHFREMRQLQEPIFRCLKKQYLQPSSTTLMLGPYRTRHRIHRRTPSAITDLR